MGGVPWTSQGCNTCRKRKVRCDLQQPQCARCIKRGVECGGYERARKFIHQSADRSPASATSATGQIQPASRKGSVIQWQHATITLPTINVNAQIRSQLFSLFIDSYVPSSADPTGQVVYRCRRSPYLVEELPRLMGGSQSALLDKAISALASVFVGKTYRDERLANHGMRLYNGAIQMLIYMMQRHKVPAEELLYATVVFQLYELINCPSGFCGWMAHMHGANAIMSRYGGLLKQCRLSTELYRHLKLSNIYHAVGKETSALKECPMWHSLSPEKKEPTDEILDILMECTIVVEQMGALQAAPNPTQAGRHVWRSVTSLKERTYAWYDRLQSTGPLYAHNKENHNIAHSTRTKHLFPDALHFTSLDIGEVHMYYWIALVLLYSLMTGLEQFGQPSHDTQQSKTESDSVLKAAHYASQICRGVGFFLRPEMNVLGGHNLLFPVAMAAQCFHRHGYLDEYQWCQEVFVALDSLGLGLATVLLAEPWSEYRSIGDEKLTEVMSEMESEEEVS